MCDGVRCSKCWNVHRIWCTVSLCVCCTIKSVTFYVVHANVSKSMCFKIVYCYLKTSFSHIQIQLSPIVCHNLIHQHNYSNGCALCWRRAHSLSASLSLGPIYLLSVSNDTCARNWMRMVTVEPSMPCRYLHTQPHT